MLSVRKLLPNPTLWFLSQQFFNAKVPAYKCLPGLIGFRRLTEFGLYRPRLFSEWPALALPTAYRPAYQQPGPLGTLDKPFTTKTFDITHPSRKNAISRMSIPYDNPV
ncbi:hypothetical protein HOY80DRAFT_1045886 [Tuber brumale]|nr:hypothetical protein HOY80DRAFT_1045886 [Tuber brumale]